MTEIASPPTECMDSTIDNLTQARSLLANKDSTTVYLANDSKTITDRVVWKQIGHGNRLITKASAHVVELSQQHPAKSSNAILQPAFLSAIVLVDSTDCWLTPCGYWKGPTKVTKKFEDVKLSFQGKPPPQHFLSEDFNTVLANAKKLMHTISSGGAKTTGFLVTSKSGGPALRFRHAVFEKLEEDSDINDTNSTISETDDPWTMSNWPVISPVAQYERDQMSSSHRPVPLPAYDINGDLIPPDRCKTSLAGAIARVSFSLNHWFIDSASRDDSSASNSFVADIHSIRVLVDPPSQPLSPVKCKTALRDPTEQISPAKKTKTNNT